MSFVFIFGIFIAFWTILRARNHEARFVGAELATVNAIGWFCYSAASDELFLDITLGAASVAFVGLLSASYILGGQSK